MKNKPKLNCIMLIDDDTATNFLHSMLLKKWNIANTIIVKESGQDALNYLLQPDNDISNIPDAIFLDLNMPLMNGWEFLEAYKNLYKDKKDDVSLFILSSSDNPEDMARAAQIDEVLDYKTKPLRREEIEDICARYF